MYLLGSATTRGGSATAESINRSFFEDAVLGIMQRALPDADTTPVACKTMDVTQAVICSPGTLQLELLQVPLHHEPLHRTTFGGKRRGSHRRARTSAIGGAQDDGEIE